MAMLTYITGPASSLGQGAFELGSGNEPLVCGLIWTAFPSHLIQETSSGQLTQVNHVWAEQTVTLHLLPLSLLIRN